MSFLYPNILWGLLAVFIPLLIHLFHSRNTVTINFSSIEYLNQLKNESIKKLNNLNWLLIILRMIIIGSLVLMFSGPIVKNKELILNKLLSGHLEGYGTDVWTNEPPLENDELFTKWKGNNSNLNGRLIVNPHTAYFSEQALLESRSKACSTCLDIINNFSINNRIV